MIAKALFILLFNSHFVLLKCECDLNTKFMESIVPSIVSEVPPEELKILYPDTPVSCGHDVDIAVTKNAPLVNYTASNIDFYTIVMIDPDAPDPHRPVFSPFLQWLVINIPGSQVKKGKVVKPYMQPSPPPYSAAHRYIIFAFRQRQYVFGSTYMWGKGRSRFDISEMKGVLNIDSLVAGNFFYTRLE